MDVKELLGQLWNKKKEIDEKKERLQQLNAFLEGMSFNCSDMPKNPSPSLSPMEDLICRKYDLEKEIESEQNDLNILQSKVYLIIDQLDNKQARKVLIDRYLLFKSWRKIASDHSFSVSYVYELHRDGLRKLGRGHNLPEAP